MRTIAQIEADIATIQQWLQQHAIDGQVLTSLKRQHLRWLNEELTAAKASLSGPSNQISNNNG